MTRDEYITQHLPLTKRIAGRMAKRLPRYVDMDDLCSAATLGLIDAAERFNPDRGVKFETFATRRMVGSILDQLRAEDWTPRLVGERSGRAASQDDARYKVSGEPPEERPHRDEVRVGVMQMSAFDKFGGAAKYLRPRAKPDENRLEHDDWMRYLMRGFSASDRLFCRAVLAGDANGKEAGEAIGVSQSMASIRLTILRKSLAARIRAWRRKCG